MRLYWTVWLGMSIACSTTVFFTFLHAAHTSPWVDFSLGWTWGALVSLGIVTLIRVYTGKDIT